ncbi:ROK family protein [Stakelama tenebrarum]|uniref:fructokinase n=1 Tax=Stakelama tenebrarum TaxID=2711215 RepID=A0A6G6Y3I8_9SPHN|nr:ROK family protein [Sphingosinithalassobacter tenebrarum]QIG79411.1 ROK family protein [Sphingosinithalassobacter tenebrarum]
MAADTPAPRIAGLELGGTKCVAILASGPTAVAARQSVPTTTPEATLGALEALLAGWEFDAIGIASFGPLELDPARADHGCITATPKHGWSGVDLLGRMTRRFRKPTGFQTDVNGAALAEARWGAARGLSDHVYITIGTGVGVGMVAGGRPLIGFAHGEAGHMRVPRVPGDEFAGQCRFHRDCVEGLISGPALAERFGRAPAELADDDPCWSLFVHDLGGLLHNLAVTLVPQQIAIGGGVVADRPFLFPMLRKRLAESLAGYGSLSHWAAGLDCRLVPPGLGAMAGPLGAIAVGLEALDG